MRRQTKTRAALLIVAAVMVGIGLVACGTTTVTKQETPTTPSQSAPAESTPTESTPAPEPAKTGPVGTTFTITETDADGTATAFKIRLDKVVEPAKPDPEYVQYGEPVKAGHHVVGMLFYVEGVQGKIYADPEMGLTATGSNGEVYQFSSMGLAGREDFQSTDLMPGEHRSGWMAFEVTDGTRLVSVRYEPMSMSLSDATVTWQIG